MLDKFITYIREKALFGPEEKVLLAVSGGIDSMVLLHLFSQAGFSFGVAHCNFGLRGEESDADEAFVKKLAKKYKAPVYTEQFETAAFAEREKISIQMAARVLRYEWFGKLLRTEGYAYVATAHHLNDTVETVLLNLTRGTGIAGLHGILPKNGRTIRPMLFVDKETLYDYVVENQLVWREDSSNETNQYGRNLVRNEVVPLLKGLNPNLEETLAHTVERVGAVERVFAARVDALRQAALRTDGEVHYLSLPVLRGEPEPGIELGELLKDYHFNYAQALDVAAALDAEPGKRFDSPTHTLVKDRDQLVVTPKPLTFFQTGKLEGGQPSFENEVLKLAAQTLPVEGYKISTSPKVAALDLQTLKFPLRIRRWKEGDWFCPLGMTSKKKISDFLIDEKVPLNLKERVWVLLSGDSIAWIIGHRIDNRFKITDKTEQVYQVEVRSEK
jgi:tRNA(Ile)-lysidine synthase